MRAERLVRAARQRRLEKMAASLRDRAAWLHVEVEGDAVVVSGKRVLKRWLADPALRFVGEVSR